MTKITLLVNLITKNEEAAQEEREEEKMSIFTQSPIHPDSSPRRFHLANIFV